MHNHNALCTEISATAITGCNILPYQKGQDSVISQESKRVCEEILFRKGMRQRKEAKQKTGEDKETKESRNENDSGQVDTRSGESDKLVIREDDLPLHKTNTHNQTPTYTNLTEGLLGTARIDQDKKFSKSFQAVNKLAHARQAYSNWNII